MRTHLPQVGGIGGRTVDDESSRGSAYSWVPRVRSNRAAPTRSLADLMDAVHAMHRGF
jgi:hypothetical protein